MSRKTLKYNDGTLVFMKIFGSERLEILFFPTKTYLDIVLIGVLVNILSPNFPLFLNIIQPLNESRKQRIYIKVEYFLDPSKYIFLFYLHLMIFLCLGMLTILATATMLYNYLLHACGVFKIAKFCDMLMSQIEKPFFMVLIFSMASLSICMFRLMQAIIAHENMVDIFIPAILFVAHVCVMFFGSHAGQQIANNNAEIYDTAYQLQWYAVSQNLQKLVLFLLQKGTKNFYLSFGGIYNVTYEGFTTIMTTAISYFTVIYAIQ